MTELTMRLRVDLPPAFDLVRPYADLVAASQTVLDDLIYFDDKFHFCGPDEKVEALRTAVTDALQLCCEMDASLPLASAPQSSGDMILRLTGQVAELSEMMVAHHNARRTAEKALAEITRIAEQTLADIDGQLDAMSASVTSRRNAS